MFLLMPANRRQGQVFSSDAYGYEKTLKLIKATIKDLTGRSGNDPEKICCCRRAEDDPALLPAAHTEWKGKRRRIHGKARNGFS